MMAPMSIKRTKQVSHGRQRETEANSPFASMKPKEAEKTWAEHVEGKADDVFVPYSLAARYERGALLAHPKFGKGAVVAVEGSRVEVLFESGTKKLGHGSS